MSFKLAVLCEHAAVEPDGKLSVFKIFSQISAQSFPPVHPRMVLACSILIPESIRHEHVNLRVDRIDEDGRTLHVVVSDTCILGGDYDDTRVFNFSVELKNLTFDKPGEYQFSIFVHENLFEAVQLRLVQPV